MNINARSICNKLDELNVVLCDNNLDISCVTETWVNDEVSNNCINMSNYDILWNDRVNKKGGGVLILIKTVFKYEEWNNVSDDETHYGPFVALIKCPDFSRIL